MSRVGDGMNGDSNKVSIVQDHQKHKPAVGVQPSFFSVEQLQELLQVDKESIGCDAQLLIACGQAMDPIHHERAEWIIEEPSSPFKRLFLSERGGMLVVDRVDGMDTEVDTIPSLSYFSAVLRQKLESMQCIVPLNFFCGMHTEPEDSLDGACGIMRSLTSQLLRQKFNFDLSFLDLAFVDKIRAHNISHLCLWFRNLLKSAKAAAIFCIIDGISRFDTEDKKSDVKSVLKYLQELDKDIATTTPSSESNGVFLHVLVTSPKPSQFSRRWIHTGQSIIMPAKSWWPRDQNI